jgi:hypothetical protein
VKTLLLLCLMALSAFGQQGLRDPSFLQLVSRPPLPSSGITLSFLGAYSTNATQSSYTWSGVSFGAAAANRVIVVAFGTRDGGSSLTFPSCTIGGISATLAVATNNTTGGNMSMAGIFYATVPTGTTGDIVLTFNETTLRARIGTYRATGVSSVNIDAQTTTGTTTTFTVTGASGCALVATALSASNTSYTWSGANEDYDGAVGTSTSSGGSSTSGTAGANVITATAVATGSTAGAAVALIP